MGWRRRTAGGRPVVVSIVMARLRLRGSGGAGQSAQSKGGQRGQSGSVGHETPFLKVAPAAAPAAAWANLLDKRMRVEGVDSACKLRAAAAAFPSPACVTEFTHCCQEPPRK